MSEGTQPAAAMQGLPKSLIARLYSASHAGDFGLSQIEFEEILAATVAKYCPEGTEPDRIALVESLRHEELALARGCVKGNEKAWEVFLTRYRSSLYSAAYTIARNDAAARELADSIYAELYGLDERAGQRRSKLLYYMGRGSLEGWLRTVLAQEWVNRKRRARREVSLEEQLDSGAQFEATTSAAPAPATPTSKAVAAVLGDLTPQDRFLLAAYYLDGRTLAQIAIVMRVHESTISRKIDRLVQSLRKDLRKRLIEGGMSPREADETIAEVDVRDLEVKVRDNLKQESPPSAF